MAGSPELVIPVRLDPGKAAAALRALGKAGMDAGDQVAGGAKKADVAVAGVGTSAFSAAKAMGGMAVANSVFSAVQERAKEVSDYIHKMAADFVALQKTMQSVSAIMGKPNTNALNIEEARLGASANRTPEQWSSFRQAFMAKASGFIGDAKPGQPARILDDEQAMDLQIKMAEFAGAKGIKDQEMADLVGGVIAQEKGPTTSAELQKRIGKAYAQLEQASKEPQLLVPGLTASMAQGMSLEEVAPKLAEMPQIAPGEESTYLKSAIQHLKQARGEGKLKDFGVTDEMSANEMLETVVKFADKEAGQGPLRGKKMTDILGKITHFHQTTDTLAGLANRGPADMQRWKDIGLNTPDDAIQQAIDADRATEAGQQRAAEAQAGRSKAEEGARFAETERELEKSRTELRDEGRFTENNWEDVGRKRVEQGISVPLLGQVIPGTGVPVMEQLANERTRDRLRAQASGMGIRVDSSAANELAGPFQNQAGVLLEIKDLLAKIHEKQGGNTAAPPPNPPGRIP